MIHGCVLACMLPALLVSAQIYSRVLVSDDFCFHSFRKPAQRDPNILKLRRMPEGYTYGTSPGTWNLSLWLVAAQVNDLLERNRKWCFGKRVLHEKRKKRNTEGGA